MADVDIFSSKLLSVFGIKFDLFSIEIVGSTFPKHQSVFIPVVKYKFIVWKFQNILVILDDQTRDYFLVYNFRNLFVVKLQKVRKRFS